MYGMLFFCDNQISTVKRTYQQQWQRMIESHCEKATQLKQTHFLLSFCHEDGPYASLFSLSTARRILGQFFLRTHWLNVITFWIGCFCRGLSYPQTLIAFATKPQCSPIVTLNGEILSTGFIGSSQRADNWKAV